MTKRTKNYSVFKLNQWVGIQVLARLAGSSPPKAKKAMLFLGLCDTEGIPTTQTLIRSLAIHRPNLRTANSSWTGDPMGFYQWNIKVLPTLTTQCALAPHFSCKTKAVGGRASAVLKIYDMIESVADAASQCGYTCQQLGGNKYWPHADNIRLASPTSTHILGMTSRESCPKNIHYNIWDQAGRDAPKLLLHASNRLEALFAIKQGLAFCKRLQPLVMSSLQLSTVSRSEVAFKALTRWAKQYDFTKPAKLHVLKRVAYITRQYTS